MQRLSFKKISILGLVLMAASAITAAMAPGRSDKKAINLAAGSITDNSLIQANGDVSSVTCAPDTANGVISDLACTASTDKGSLTTGGTGGGITSSNNSPSSESADYGVGQDNTSSDN